MGRFPFRRGITLSLTHSLPQHSPKLRTASSDYLRCLPTWQNKTCDRSECHETDCYVEYTINGHLNWYLSYVAMPSIERIAACVSAPTVLMTDTG